MKIFITEEDSLQNTFRDRFLTSKKEKKINNARKEKEKSLLHIPS